MKKIKYLILAVLVFNLFAYVNISIAGEVVDEQVDTQNTGLIFEGLGIITVEGMDGKKIKFIEGAISVDRHPNVFMIEDGKIAIVNKEAIKTGARIAFDQSGEEPEGSMKNIWIIKDTSLYNDMMNKGFRITEKGVEFPPFTSP